MGSQNIFSWVDKVVTVRTLIIVCVCGGGGGGGGKIRVCMISRTKFY